MFMYFNSNQSSFSKCIFNSCPEEVAINDLHYLHKEVHSSWQTVCLSDSVMGHKPNI